MPMVAVMNGHAFAGGLMLGMMHDVSSSRIGARHETRHGPSFVPGRSRPIIATAMRAADVE